MPAKKDPDRAFFGHPAGLSTLFFTEMWERLSYYGARTFLAIYMVTAVDKGGRGMSDESTGLVMALYMSSVYLLSLPGGWIADRFLGQRKAVLIGGVGISVGNALLAFPSDDTFFPGLAVIAIGTGFLKPNISTLVGQLYKPDDIRRDSGFTIYYMGINIGAFFAPFIGVLVAQSDSFREMLANQGVNPNLCWRFAFAVPAVGMVFGLAQYLVGWKKLGDTGLHPTIPSEPKKAARDRLVLGGIAGGMVLLVVTGVLLDATGLVEMTGDLLGNVFGIGLAIAAVLVFVGYYMAARSPEETKRITAMIPLFIGAICFFGVFEQASTTLSLFAERLVHRDYLGFNVPASAYQFPNALFIILLASPFAYMWLKLAKAGKEPSAVTKFGIGMLLTGLSFVILLPTLDTITERTNTLELMNGVPYIGDVVADSDYHRVSPNYLILLYFISTMAELFISPVGLSSMSKLAPRRLAGMVMGTWFLATAIGNYIAGQAAGFSATRGYSFLFSVLIGSALIISIALFVVAPIIRKMLAGPSTVLPKAVAIAMTEPEPLPKGTKKADAKLVDKKSEPKADAKPEVPPTEPWLDALPKDIIKKVEDSKKAEADKKLEAKASSEAEEKATKKLEAKPDAKAEAKPDVKAEAKSDVKAEAKPDVKVEAKPDAKADAKPEAKPDAKPEAKPDAKAEAKPDAKAEAKADAKDDKKDDKKA
jgi:POT family proton-dependent oligopeptide transporter